jgi:hypothetical protein
MGHSSLDAWLTVRLTEDHYALIRVCFVRGGGTSGRQSLFSGTDQRYQSPNLALLSCLAFLLYDRKYTSF